MKKDYCTNNRDIDVIAKQNISHSYNYWNMSERIPAIPRKIQGWRALSCYKRMVFLQVEKDF